MFPSELSREEIFQNNLSHVLNDLKKLIEENQLLKGNRNVLKYLKFDSQREKQLRLIEENKKRISEIENKMNKEISPFYWQIIKDFNGFYDLKHYIIADYLLVLRQ